MTRAGLADWASVPVVPVLAWLGRRPVYGCRWWCVFHDDEHPGGNPSAEVSPRDPTEFHCWNCGRRATAAGLLAELTGTPLAEAIDRAIAIAGTVEVAPAPTRPTLSPTDLEDKLRRDAVRADAYEVDPVDAFCADRGWPAEFANYARSHWQWQGGYHRVVLPHRAGAGELTGLRWRWAPDWCPRRRHPHEARWCKDGRGAFGQLYGVWRLGDADTVWILEGETDTALAGWQLEPWGIGVLGLPGGRGPRPADLKLLAGRQVTFVFDDDPTGHHARDRWAARLPDMVAVANWLELDGGGDALRTSIGRRGGPG